VLRLGYATIVSACGLAALRSAEGKPGDDLPISGFCIVPLVQVRGRRESVAKLVLLVVVGLGILLVLVWIMLRHQASTGAAERTDLLEKARDRLGGTLERVGVFGVEALILEEHG
jgi:hypothetical protein